MLAAGTGTVVPHSTTRPFTVQKQSHEGSSPNATAATKNRKNQ
jgi:hypothetical protein